MDGDGIERVVNLALEQHPRREEEEWPAEGTDDHRAPQVVHVATGAESNGAFRTQVTRKKIRKSQFLLSMIKFI